MKLYTEKQVIRLLERYKSDWYRILPPNKIINLENEIELPSDDDIEDYANDNVESISFVRGAKWLINKIKENQ